jgi:uncharacterized protein (UPF0335 family)
MSYTYDPDLDVSIWMETPTYLEGIDAKSAAEILAGQVLPYLDQVEYRITEYEHTKAQLRAIVERLLEVVGGEYDDGHHSVKMSKPSERSSYDVKAVDQIIRDCITRGETATAAALSAARQTSVIKPSMRIKGYTK